MGVYGRFILAVNHVAPVGLDKKHSDLLCVRKEHLSILHLVFTVPSSAFTRFLKVSL